MKIDKGLSKGMVNKIILSCIILILLFSVGVMASKSEIESVTISFSDNTEKTVMTSKIKVSDILSENHIILLSDEIVTPDLNSNIDFTKKIIISKVNEDKIIISENIEDISTEEILEKYVILTEKIIVEKVEIPFETITKNISKEGAETTDRVLQNGENGLKEIKYRVKYENEKEIERTIISETIIKDPVNKIIQISNKITSRAAIRNNGVSLETAIASVQGVEPKVVTLNASAYTASTCGKPVGSSGYGITASGATAKAYYTVAAGSAYPIGTVIYIPYFASSPNRWMVCCTR